jgi:hypothetical protein
MFWVSGPQQTGVDQEGYFVILNAWSVILGLPLNLGNFTPGEDFFRDAHNLIQAVLRGGADWLVIWAFLRCHRFVGSEQAPEAGRRFAKTIPTDKSDKYKARILARTAAPETGPRVNTYDQFRGGTHLRWNEDFEWYGTVGKNRKTEILERIRLRRQGKGTGTPGGRTDGPTQPPNTPSPCEQFRQKLDALLQNKRTASDLRDFRAIRKPTMKFGAWLNDEEASLAIASVTMAISNKQDFYHGFGFIEQSAVQGHVVAGGPSLQPTPHPGRPILVPLIEARHIVLLVIQLNEHHEPTFSVLDSEAFHLKAASQQHIHNWAFRLLRHSHWWEGVFTEADLKNHRPPHTEWIPVSQQPTDNECGYYTILNGWTLALGLLPDPNAVLDWSDEFFNDLRDVVHLARIGRADYSMIETFLKCRRFVLDGQVPDGRRFARTIDPTTQFEHLQNAAGDLRVDDGVLAGEDLGELWNNNRINLPPERAHNDAAAFPSDKWSRDARALANELARNGKSTLDFNEAQLRAAHAALASASPKASELRRQLEGKNANFRKQPRDQLITACRNYLSNWHTGKNTLIENRPCEISHQTTRFYEHLFQGYFLGHTPRSEGFNGNWNDLLESSEVNLGIAAVVEAIDDLQSQQHQERASGSVFAGGFSLTTSNDLALGEGTTVSRPRRAFFMPLSILAEGHLGWINN